jgi:hypothetical protein
VKFSGEAVTLGDGDIVDCDDLHLHTARRVNASPNCRGVHTFEVCGKPRPVIILYEIEGSAERVKVFRAVRLSTKISEHKKRLGYRRLGPILDERISYMDSTPCCLPANLVVGTVRKRIGRLELLHVYRIIRATFAAPMDG